MATAVYIRAQLRSVHCSTKHRNQKGRDHATPEIDMPWYNAQLERQNNRCFHSGIALKFDASPESASIERLDNSIGYTLENCVLILKILNTAAPWSAEFIKQLRSLRRQTDHEDDMHRTQYLHCLLTNNGTYKTEDVEGMNVIEVKCSSCGVWKKKVSFVKTTAGRFGICPTCCDCSRLWHRNNNRKRKRSLRKPNRTEDNIALDCVGCNTIKPSDQFQFLKRQQRYFTLCRPCYNHRQRILKDNPLSFIKTMVSRLPFTTNHRNHIRQKHNKSPMAAPSIDYKWVAQEIMRTNGLCALFRVPYLLDRTIPQLQLSIDRIDDNIGYTPSNCRLVIFAANGRSKWIPELVNQLLIPPK